MSVHIGAGHEAKTYHESVREARMGDVMSYRGDVQTEEVKGIQAGNKRVDCIWIWCPRRAVVKKASRRRNPPGSEKHVMRGLEDIDRVLEVMVRVLLPIHPPQAPQQLLYLVCGQHWHEYRGAPHTRVVHT